MRFKVPPFDPGARAFALRPLTLFGHDLAQGDPIPDEVPIRRVRQLHDARKITQIDLAAADGEAPTGAQPGASPAREETPFQDAESLDSSAGAAGPDAPGPSETMDARDDGSQNAEDYSESETEDAANEPAPTGQPQRPRRRRNGK